jgi:hypothetical protein
MSDEIPESKLNVQKQLDEIIAFTATGAFRSYVRTMQLDLQNVEASILETPPLNEANIASALKLFGRREELSRSITFFEDAQATLRNQLIAIGDLESQEPDND